MSFEEIATAETFKLPPDSGGSAAAYSRLGYELVDALADIIDNSIDSKASQVEIIFHRSGDRIAMVTIADDGHGMTQSRLREAMQFAGDNQHKEGDLGTYGLGLKTASFSQCECLTVVTRKSNDVAACRWTKEGISNNWTCELLDQQSAAAKFGTCYSIPPRSTATGTVVAWERLTRLECEEDFEEFVTELLARLELQLGLIFHRFIESERLAIKLSSRDLDSILAFPREVRAHDPFGYSQSAREGYPKVFETSIPKLGPLQLTAHIWPAGATEPNFRLGRRTGTHAQGFYVYRNDRLIQCGGWLGVWKDDTDAELSLARVAIELPKRAGRSVSVQKSALQMTAALPSLLRGAKSGKKLLSAYLEDARKIYRASRIARKSYESVPVVPGSGIPAAARRGVANLLAEDDFVREIAFEWIWLPKGTVFSIEPDEDRILLNDRYRHRMLGHSRASSADLPIVKLLLFLLLSAEFDRERFSAKRREWLKRCNAILYEAVKGL